MKTYYYTKEDSSKWRGDDHGAETAAKEKHANAEAISDKFDIAALLENTDEDEEIEIFVKGTNLPELQKALKSDKNKNVNLSRVHFHVGGNQTQMSLDFVKDLLHRVLGKNLHVDMLPGNLNIGNKIYLGTYGVESRETTEAITGKKTSQLEMEAKDPKAVETIEEITKGIGDEKFITIHWGGPVGGETLSDEENLLHQQLLIKQLKQLKAENPNIKFLFVPHGGRSFKAKNDDNKVIQKTRREAFVQTLKNELGEDKIVTPTGNKAYTASLAFTKNNAEKCKRIISTAENLSTIAEQLSVIDEKKRPELEVMQLPCCKQNNKYWESMAKLKDGWLKGVKAVTLTNPSRTLKSNLMFCFTSCFKNDTTQATTTTSQNQRRLGESTEVV